METINKVTFLPEGKTYAKPVQDMAGLQATRVVRILYERQDAGRIIANFSNNLSGSVCTAQVSMYRGPLEDMPLTCGKAGGYGYCKFSSAVNHAVCDVMPKDSDHRPDFAGCGESAMRKWFEQFGYELDFVL